MIPIANNTLGSITPADINNDGIIDFITTAGGIEDTVLWFKNLGILGLEDIKGLSFTIAPNPSKGKISITSNTQIVHAKIYDQLGRFVFEKANDIGMKELDLTFLKTGLYFLQIINGSGEKGVKMWLKQ